MEMESCLKMGPTKARRYLVLLQPLPTMQRLRTLALRAVAIYLTKKLSLINRPFTIGGGHFYGATNTIRKHAKDADLGECLVYTKILATFIILKLGIIYLNHMFSGSRLAMKFKYSKF